VSASTTSRMSITRSRRKFATEPKNQVRYPGGGPYDAATRREHLSHVHFATSEALAKQILARLEKK